MTSRTRTTGHQMTGTRSTQVGCGSPRSALIGPTTAIRYRACPSRPCGRNASTAAMIRKVKTTE